ncbi:MAG: restriction endonuclease [Epsilonproteobacteria bacterium]|nr:restriction endonuclease [Campylobacterota bacterium]
MDLIDKLNAIATKVEKQKATISTEEATKTSFIMPFIRELGYDVFDATEVIPEFTADVGIKKGEKVDYAIALDGKIIMLIECKMLGTKLDVNIESQLHRYFHVTEARIGILTDGLVYKFYTDLEEPNKMDNKPFLEFALNQLDDSLIQEIKKFSKQTFNIDQLLLSANELKFTKAIKAFINEQLLNPSEDFIQFILKNIYTGRITEQVKEQFTPILKRASVQLINDKVNDRLKSALVSTTEQSLEMPILEEAVKENEEKIITTEEEKEGFYSIKAILAGVVDLERVVYRDTQSYMGILLDDNNRKPIARLYLNGNKKYLAVFDADKKEEKLPITNINDLFNYRENIIASCKNYVD